MPQKVIQYRTFPNAKLRKLAVAVLVTVGLYVAVGWILAEVGGCRVRQETVTVSPAEDAADDQGVDPIGPPV
jgi:hypothetical protein